MTSQSATSSTTSLLSTRQQPTPKNYEAAFGALSSSYGFGGGVPIVPSKKSPKLGKKTIQPSTTQPTRKETGSSSTKNYSAAFAKLASSYGFGGGIPSLPSGKK